MGLSQTSEFRLLVVEDSEDLVAVWRALFRTTGISTKFCTSGQAALSSFQDFHPDVMMTDFYLPDLTGLELIDEVRKRSPTTDCLMVTGNTDDSFVDMVKKANVSYLFKPVRFPDLLSKLDAMLVSRSEEQNVISQKLKGFIAQL